jgi:hypothetical protein
MACTQCPDQIVEVIAANVRDTMWRIQRIQRLTTLFNRLLEEIALSYLAIIKTRLDELYDLIPEPPIADVNFLVGLLTCPLTPAALLLEPSLLTELDPRRIIKKFQDAGAIFLRKLETIYDLALADIEAADPRPLAIIVEQDVEALFPGDDLQTFFSGSSPNAYTRQFIDTSQQLPAPNRVIQAGGPDGVKGVDLMSPKNRVGGRSTGVNIPVRIVKKYIREIVKAFEDPVYFAIRLGETSAAVVYVKEACPDIYYSSKWPFVLWEDVLNQFQFDSTTGVPASVQGAGKDIVTKFMSIEMKLFRWQAFITAPV